MHGINICGIILDPVDTSRVGEADEGNVVKMAFDRTSELSLYRKDFTLPSRKIS